VPRELEKQWSDEQPKRLGEDDVLLQGGTGGVGHRRLQAIVFGRRAVKLDASMHASSFKEKD
jgi:hypothetical protein